MARLFQPRSEQTPPPGAHFAPSSETRTARASRPKRRGMFMRLLRGYLMLAGAAVTVYYMICGLYWVFVSLDAAKAIP